MRSAGVSCRRQVGALAAIFVAVSPYLIFQSQIARSYSMAIAAGAFAALALLRVIDQPSPGRWAVYIAATAFALYTHTVMGLATIGLAIGYLVLPSAVRNRIPVGRWLLAHVLIGVLFLPWIVRSALLVASPASVWFEEGSTFELIQRMMQSFALGSRPTSALGDVANVAMVCLATVGIAIGLRRGAEDTPNRLIALWLLVPLLLVLAISIWVPHHARPILDRRVRPIRPGNDLGACKSWAPPLRGDCRALDSTRCGRPASSWARRWWRRRRW